MSYTTIASCYKTNIFVSPLAKTISYEQLEEFSGQYLEETLEAEQSLLIVGIIQRDWTLL